MKDKFEADIKSKNLWEQNRSKIKPRSCGTKPNICIIIISWKQT